MFEELEKINKRPELFQFYTASDLWTDDHTSKQMLSFHLNEAIDVSSRNAEFINRSVEWIALEFNIGRDFKIADFGCGPGLYTTRLAKCGANVTGIDFSGRSIKFAKEVAAREQLNISYEKQNYLEFETGDRYWTNTQLLNLIAPGRYTTDCNILPLKSWKGSSWKQAFLLLIFYPANLDKKKEFDNRSIH
jgi:SAM-dependent methyltransferase